VYNDFVVNDKEITVIVQKETLNQIADLRWRGYGIQSIAAILNIAVADVFEVIKAYKFIKATERPL